MVKDEDELDYEKVFEDRFGPDRARELIASLKPSDQIELPETLYPVIEWISGPGHLLINPIFLKMYSFVKYKGRLGPELLILWSLIISLVVNFGLIICLGASKSYVVAGHVALIMVLSLLGITLIRMLIITLLVTPKMIANELERGLIHSVFPTPLSDDEIFYGSSMAHLLKAYPIIEEMLSMLFGYTGVYVLVQGAIALNMLVFGNPDAISYVMTVTLWSILCMIGVPFLSLLASRAAGLYSLTGSWLGVFFSGLGHVTVVGLISWGLGALVIYLGGLLESAISIPVGMIAVIGAFIVIVVFVWYACTLTGQLGVWALGRYRRKSESFW